MPTTDALSWQVDQAAGRITWRLADGTGARARIQLVGTHDGRSWKWAWGNASLWPDLCRDAERLRQHGEREGWEALTTPTWLSTARDVAAMGALGLDLLDADVSVLVGLSATGGVATAFVWTTTTGMQAIPMPPEAIGSQAVDVSADGQFVYGAYSLESGVGLQVQHFVWSESGGLHTIRGPALPNEWAAMAMSGDVYRFVMNVDPADPTIEERGARLNEYALHGAEGLWAGHGLAPVEASGVFWAVEAAVSHTGTVVGGFCTPRGGGWVTSAIWSESTGVLQTAPGVVGRTCAVSPDGLLAGGGNGDRGTAFTWDAANGHQDLIVAIVRMDDQRGLDLESTFAPSGGLSYVLAISADNARIVGTAGDAIFGMPCYGFVLDLP